MCVQNTVNFISPIFKRLDWPNALLGGIIGLALVKLVDWIRRPKLKFLGFGIVPVSFGKLVKLSFKLDGGINPGVGCCEIVTNSEKTCYAKWDESPNPLKNDKLGDFVPEKVPATYYQTLFLKKIYSVPILIEDPASIPQLTQSPYRIFNAWWFGKGQGYYIEQPMKYSDFLTIIVRGNGFLWERQFTVKEVLRLAGV